MRILSDTGQGIALESNARSLGVDLGETDILMLSHGHYDRAGGIAQMLQRAHKANDDCQPGVEQPRYAIQDGAPKSTQCGASDARKQAWKTHKEAVPADDRLKTPAFRGF